MAKLNTDPTKGKFDILGFLMEDFGISSEDAYSILRLEFDKATRTYPKDYDDEYRYCVNCNQLLKYDTQSYHDGKHEYCI